MLRYLKGVYDVKMERMLFKIGKLTVTSSIRINMKHAISGKQDNFRKTCKFIACFYWRGNAVKSIAF